MISVPESSGHIFTAPLTDRIYYRGKSFSAVCQGIFSFGRDDRINFTVYKAVIFKLTQLLREHFWCSLRQIFLKFIETQYLIFNKMVKDDCLIFSANLADGSYSKCQEKTAVRQSPEEWR